MSFKLAFSIEGETQLSRKLLNVSTSLTNFKEPFTETGNMMANFIRKDVFSSQGSVIGEPWKRLSPYTIATKARHSYPSTPLVATGAMQNSFYSIASSNQVVIGNTQDYFKYHQSNKPRSKIPRRIMLKIDEQRKTDIVRIFQRYLHETVSQP